MEVSDKAVATFLGVLFRSGWSMRAESGMTIGLEMTGAGWEERVANALRAALAVMPDQYRAGWIAGRDAAAEHVCGYCVRQNSICADHIRNMEPPA